MIIQQCNENILRKLPAYCTKLAIEKINTFEKDIKQQIEYNRKYSLFSESDHALWLKQECEHFVKGFGNVLYPQIIDHAVLQCKKVSEQLGQVLAQGKNKLGDNIKFQTNLLGPSVSLYDDYDSVFEKIGKTILAGLAIVPVAVFVIADELINGADRIKSELKRSLYDFCSQLKQQVEKNESKLKDKLNDVKLIQ